MTHIRAIIRKSCLILAVALLALTMPLATLSSASADSTCTPPDPASYGAGVHEPVGSEAKAFVYQCEGPFAGLWLSERYVYFPQDNRTEPRDEVIYYYNKATDKYDYTYWAWLAAQNRYVQTDASATNPPAGAKTVGSRAAALAQAAAAAAAANAGPSGTSVSNTGPGSNTNVNNNTNNNGTINNNNSATVTNTIGSTATSGNAAVLNNTNAGNATSGDVITQANVTNMLQSTSNALGDGSNVATFTYTIDGDYFGDLMFDPTAIENVQGNVNVNDNLNNNLTINNNNDATINNNLTLDSQSGNATVANNTTGGDATTGNARSIANIVNSIRSAITSGKSFIGTINITGNLNGDILLPANFVDQLIASNVPTVSVTAPGSNVNNNTTTNNNTTVTNNNTQGINNTISSTATSGNASVDSNTNGGSATSGKTSTNVTAFNLTGSRVVAKNSVLVYVNALGKWTGLIVNAPDGATAAMIGGNVTTNKTVNNNTNVTNNTNQQINNNVNVRAGSGDASVSSNTNGGSAKSGDAQTAVNLVNIEDSSFELSDWFGILYINVFGTWNGSFGMDTDAGNIGGRGADEQYLMGNVSKLVRYPATARAVAKPTSASATASAGDTTATASVENGTVLAAETKPVQKIATTPKDSQSASSKLWLPLLGLLVAIALLGSEKVFRRSKTVS